MNIFVGNLSYGATDGDLRKAFEAFGTVASASVIVDKFTGKSRGFGFVEMPDAAQAKAAIEALNNQDLNGRPMRVNEAKPREDRPPRREGGGGYGGGGGREGGYSQRRSGGYGPRN